MKIQIECSENEARLISSALELYSRVGILQFEYLTECSSLQNLIWKDETYKLQENFRRKADAMKGLFGYTPNSNPGIFNTTDVEDDVRIAAHLHQQIRHEFWKLTGKPQHTVSAYPADICNIADIPIPDFEIKIETDG